MTFPPPNSQYTDCTSVYYNDIPIGTICCRIEAKENVHHLYLLTMGILAVRPDWVLSTVSVLISSHVSLALSISWHRLIQFRCHLASCRGSCKAQNLPHLPSCASLKPRREAVLRTTWFQGERHRRRLLQEDHTERRLGTRTRYRTSGGRAELIHQPFRQSIEM